MRLILCSLIVLAWTSGPIYAPKPLPPTAAPAPAAEAAAPAIDFGQLHIQAREALDRLRQAQAAHRMKVASVN